MACVLRLPQPSAVLLAHKARFKPTFLVQVHLPLYDPYTLLNLCLFSDTTTRQESSPARMIGKMRVRLSTLQPGTSFKASLQ